MHVHKSFEDLMKLKTQSVFHEVPNLLHDILLRCYVYESLRHTYDNIYETYLSGE